ncbi:MAG: lipopolysaccharide biosynthesis protein [Bacteroidetes bacterium]|nr:lipopolysaccharide biosynthesis protein [Bacteroidota bacterium]
MGQTQNYKDEINLKQLIQGLNNWYAYLKIRWKSIVSGAFIVGILGLVLALITKPVYVSNSSFVLENNNKSKLGGYSNLAAQFGLNLPGNAGGLFLDDDNIIAFMQSRTMIARTLRTQQKFGSKNQLIIDRYLDFSGLREKWKAHPKIANLKFHTDPAQSSILEDSIITICYKEILKENFTVGKPDKDLSIIALSTTAKDELFAKAFTEQLLANVTDFYIEMQTKKSLQNVLILRQQVDSVRGLLNNALTGVAVTSEENPNPNPAYQRLKVPTQRRLVDVEMNKAILEELVKNLELSEMSLRKETPLVQVIDSPVLPLEKKKIGKLKGLVLGALLGGFLIAIYFSLKFYLSNILTENKS